MWKLLTFTSLRTYSADRLFWLWYWKKRPNIYAVISEMTARPTLKKLSAHSASTVLRYPTCESRQSAGRSSLPCVCSVWKLRGAGTGRCTAEAHSTIPSTGYSATFRSAKGNITGSSLPSREFFNEKQSFLQGIFYFGVYYNLLTHFVKSGRIINVYDFQWRQQK